MTIQATKFATPITLARQLWGPAGGAGELHLDWALLTLPPSYICKTQWPVLHVADYQMGWDILYG